LHVSLLALIAPVAGHSSNSKSRANRIQLVYSKEVTEAPQDAASTNTPDMAKFTNS